MSIAFAPTGSYNVQLGDSFLSPKKSAGLYTLRFNSKPDSSLKSRPGILHENDELCMAEWVAVEDHPEVVYEGVPGNVQDIDCLLLFDEETQTFVLERQRNRLMMKKSTKRKTPSQNKFPAKSPPMESASKLEPAAKKATPRPAAISPIPTQRKTRTGSSSVTTITPTIPPVKLALPNIGHTAITDDFDFDLSKDIDEILGDDNDDDGDEDDDIEDTFEEITPTAVYTSPATQTRPPALVLTPVITPSPTVVSPANPSPGNTRRKLQMASAPIRHPSPRVSTPSKKPSNTAATTSESDGESGTTSESSGSGSSSSGSGSESGSSSESESGDDDMEDLEKDIVLNMSSEEPTSSLSPRPTPTIHDAPLSANQYQKSPLSGRASSGPMSLRALYKDGDEEEEEEGSSSSSDSDVA